MLAALVIISPRGLSCALSAVQEIYIDDLREEFVRDFVFPMFRCDEHLHVSD